VYHVIGQIKINFERQSQAAVFFNSTRATSFLFDYEVLTSMEHNAEIKEESSPLASELVGLHPCF
jgi:hypothetical protein